MEPPNIENYSLLRRDRGSRGGGVAIYIRNCIKHYSLNIVGGLEQLWIMITVNGVKISLGVVYRPPNSSLPQFFDEMEDTLADIVLGADVIILTGDFNVNLLTLDSGDARRFCDLLASFNLTQIIDLPTRVALGVESLIDLICISDRDLVADYGNLPGLSDHQVVRCRLKFNIERNTITHKLVRSFKTIDLEQFLQDLRQICFYGMFDITTVHDKVTYLMNCLFAVFDVHIPIVKVKSSRPPAPWITHTIREMQQLRDSAYRKYSKTKTEANWKYYKDIRNYTNAAVDRERRAFIESEIRSGKNVWRILKRNKVLNTVHFNSFPAEFHNPDSFNKYYVSQPPDSYNVDMGLLQYYKSNRTSSRRFLFR